MNEVEAADAMLSASRALVAVAARSLADADDVTLPQYRALVVLTASEAVTVGILATALDVHPSTVTRMCDRLVRKGLIRRVPGAADDRRETRVMLTGRGRRLVERVTSRRLRDLQGIAGRMSPTDRRRALEGLTAFARAAGEIPGPDPFGWFGAEPAPESGRRI